MNKYIIKDSISSWQIFSLQFKRNQWIKMRSQPIQAQQTYPQFHFLKQQIEENQPPPQEVQKCWNQLQYEYSNSQYFSIMGNIYRLTKSSKQKILSGQKKIYWADSFVTQFEARIIDSDFESMKLQLKYGNYVLEISVIWTELDDKFILSNSQFGSGCNGAVYEYHDNQQTFVIKGINYNAFEEKNNLSKIYLQYFICCVASNLEVGPKVASLFQYDVVIFKNRACFAMEKCREYEAFKPEIFESLKEPLAALHSVGILHLDIKPNNIAYSRLFKKWVFIDFGFSRIVERPVGWRFLTGFTGTVEYCSAEMKRSYMLSQPVMVDLYQNDALCLENSREKQKKKYKYFNILLQSEAAEDVIGYKNQLLQSTIEILRLKSYIFQGKIQKIETFVSEEIHLKKTVLLILTGNEAGLRIKQNQKIKLLIRRLRKDLLSAQLQSSFCDQYFYTFLTRDGQASFIPTYMNYHYLLELPVQKFRKFTDNLEIIRKLFSIIDPFSKFFHLEIEQKISVQRKLIEKVYQGIYGNHKKTCWFQKVRKSLFFFYQKLLPLKDRKICNSLKLLFFCGYDSNIGEIITNCIKFSQTPQIKLLTLIENGLLRQFINGHYDRTNSLYEPQLIDESDLKSFGLVGRLYSLFCQRRIFPEWRQKQRDSILSLLDQIEKQQAYTDLAQSIKSLFYELENYHSERPEQYQQNPAHRIYSSAYRNSGLKIEPEICNPYQIFAPPMLTEEIFTDKEKLKYLLRVLFRHLRQMNNAYPYFIIDRFQHKFAQNEDLLLELIVQYEEHMSYFVLQQQKFAFLCLDLSFWMVRNIIGRYLISFQPTSSQAQPDLKIISKVETIFQDYSKKVCCSISQQFWFQIMRNSLEGIFLHLKQSDFSQITRKLDQILTIVRPLPYYNHPIFSFFLYFLVSLKPYCLLQGQQFTFYRNTIFEIVSAYKSRQIYCIYQAVPIFMEIPIMSYFKEGRDSEGVELLQSFINHVLKQRPFFEANTYWQTIKVGSECLCTYTAKETKIKFLNRFSGKRLCETSGQILYVEYKIFFSLIQHYDKNEIRKQIVRLCLGSSKVFHLFSKYDMRNSVCKACRYLKLFGSNRTKLFLIKQERNSKTLVQYLQRKVKRFPSAIKNVFQIRLNKLLEL